VFERFTEEARQVVVLAQDESRLLRHHYIGTEHLLLGLLREEGAEARALGARGVTLERAREQVKAIVGEGEEEARTGQIPFTPRAKQVLERALREALTLGHDYIGAEHVLLGLGREVHGVAARIIFELGATPRELAADVTALLEGQPPPGYVEGFAAEPGATREGRPELVRLVLGGPRGRRVAAASLLAGWLLFAAALGIGVLVGWLIWG
jgi:ATP-dependent Clp protease ATP-binding subunit ClpC